MAGLVVAQFTAASVGVDQPVTMMTTEKTMMNTIGTTSARRVT